MPPPPAEAVAAAAAASRKRGANDSIARNNNNKTAADGQLGQHKIVRRAQHLGVNWGPSHLSTSPGIDWADPDNFFIQSNDDGEAVYYYTRDDSECDGQVVYIIENAFDPDNPAFELLRDADHIETLPHTEYGNWYGLVQPDSNHATAVASIVAGQWNGVCKAGKVTLVRTARPGTQYLNTNEGVLGSLLMDIESLVEALQDIASKNRAHKSVINMSWSATLQCKSMMNTWSEIQPFH